MSSFLTCDLIILTDKYSGNFSRELCARLVGCVGCDPIEEVIRQYETYLAETGMTEKESEDWVEVNLRQESGEWGPTYSDIFRTKEGSGLDDGWATIIYMSEKPVVDVLEGVKVRAQAFCDENEIVLREIQYRANATCVERETRIVWP